MITAEQRGRLAEIVRRVHLDRVFRDLDDLGNRLELFCAEYVRFAQAAPRGMIPSTVTVDAVIAEFEQNPQRVAVLLQAIAFGCTPPVLAAVWMVAMGADVARVHLDYVSREQLDLTIGLSFGFHEEQVQITSHDVWDLAFLRLVGLVKGDDRPILSGVYPMYLRG